MSWSGIPVHSAHKFVARNYLWCLGIDKEVEELDKGCEKCQSIGSAPDVLPLHSWLWQ